MKRYDPPTYGDCMQEAARGDYILADKAEARIAALEGGIRELFSAMESLAFCAPEMRYVHEARVNQVRALLKEAK